MLKRLVVLYLFVAFVGALTTPIVHAAPNPLCDAPVSVTTPKEINGAAGSKTDASVISCSKPLDDKSNGNDVATKPAGLRASQTDQKDPCLYEAFQAAAVTSYNGVTPDQAGTSSKLQGMPPPAGETVNSGYWVAQWCPGAGTTYSWVRNGDPAPAGLAAPLADPRQLAITSAAQTAVTTPSVHVDPYLLAQDGVRYATLKNVHTWFWADQVSWQPIKPPRVTAGPVWVEITITPVALVIDPADGVSPVKVCDGPGTLLPANTPMSQPSPTCSVQFGQQTDGGTWPMTVSARYAVTWIGFDGAGPVTGTLPQLVAPPVAYPIAVLTAKPELVDPNSPPRTK